jgi:beta-D-galactosyl-(1->4)-L-rhamnose phosphorylase
MTTSLKSGHFTLPGEAGYEKLTLELAKRWGADTVRDSDGTVLSDDIIKAGYDVYSTICLVRSDNAYAKANMDKLQQNFLMSFPVIADGPVVSIDPLEGYFREQFTLNTMDDPKQWWQVYDRTTGTEVPLSQWKFDPNKKRVIINSAIKGHKYTVNFLTVRIWEEISMYNHITNNWGNREHLMTIDPMYPQVQEFILGYLDKWLKEHPVTKVVRFTSMFYNFTWFWGEDLNNRYLYGDWGDYQMMASPTALRAFEKAKGYRLTSEDFVNGGLYNCTHNAPSKRYRDWMDFIHGFVIDFGKKCIDLVHKHGKKAYVFYDDHWIGVEPYSDRFKEFGFDGIIKCVFNAFEARLCAGVKDVKTRELRLHPYLFPTGLKGEPTFKEGGDPTRDAKNFWINIRRGLLRAPVDRIGLGGYLHLVEPYPDFVDYIEKLTQEFRTLKALHENDKPYVGPAKVAILTAWGNLRAWICSGHMTPGLELNELIESIAGLPVDVQFISFDDILKHGIPKDVKVIINAGRLDSAWSGGFNWKNAKVAETVAEWVQSGGGFIGVAEPSASVHSSQYFQLSDVLGVDRDTGLRIGLGKYKYTKIADHFITKDLKGNPDFGNDIDNIFILGNQTQVLADENGSPTIAVHPFGEGRAVYMSGHKFSPANARLLHRAIFWAAKREADFAKWVCTNPNTECAYYANHRKLVVINNTQAPQTTELLDGNGNSRSVSLAAHDAQIIDM